MEGETAEREELRRRILRARNDPFLNPRDRARQIQNLISPGSVPVSTSHQLIERIHWVVTESDLATTYHGHGHHTRGCKHYRVNCKIRAECCGRFYPCRFCHDETSDHKIDRYATQEMLCMFCNTIQPAGQVCTNCNATVARYYCDICKFFDDTPGKNIYHCQYCNICRVGKGLGIDYFHCIKCNACMSMNLTSHQCIENTLESNCPVCLESMFGSTIPVVFMSCNHCMHTTCFERYTGLNYSCPICSKSLGDMSGFFSRIDAFMNTQYSHEELKDCFSHILCNDCERENVVPHHYSYHKCPQCGSYNTRVLEIGQQFSVADASPHTQGSQSASSSSPSGNHTQD